jgi:hypothetical protein
VATLTGEMMRLGFSSALSCWYSAPPKLAIASAAGCAPLTPPEAARDRAAGISVTAPDLPVVDAVVFGVVVEEVPGVDAVVDELSSVDGGTLEVVPSVVDGPAVCLVDFPLPHPASASTMSSAITFVPRATTPSM